jgi:hypothetical protein
VFAFQVGGPVEQRALGLVESRRPEDQRDRLALAETRLQVEGVGLDPALVPLMRRTGPAKE